MIRKFFVNTIIVSVSIAFLVTSTVVLAAQNKVGDLTIESGTVLILRDGQEQKVEADSTLPVFSKDTVQTLPNSMAIVVLGEGDDADRFSLDEKTTFVIEEYLVQEEKPTRGFFSLLGGKLRSLVKRVKGKKDITIRTGSATIGVKGTDFLTEVPNKDVTQVTTFEGTVSLQNQLGDVLKEVDISGGQSSMVIAGNAPFSPFELSRESLLESSRIIGSKSGLIQKRTSGISSRILDSDQTIAAFQKARFDRLIEEAAKVKGALVRVKIQFPDEN